MLTGEAVGSYLPWASCVRPALPPPEVDLEAALGSIQRILDREPTTLLTSHFGAVPDVASTCETAIERIQAWAADVRHLLEEDIDTSEDDIVEALTRRARGEFEGDAGRPFEQARYDVLGSIRMNAQGIARYWRKRWEREAEV